MPIFNQFDNKGDFPKKEKGLLSYIIAPINNRAVSLTGLLDNRAVNLKDHEHSSY